ncbi:hypothetical protein QR680_004088 [Steinernema hermaphroditum]|uniref:Uncharacterized protein n=1 Tax=Steinernema hermaphroditum TaxID=289476 RepID=A0AA39HPW3_9BILA|nr:hypothetical protein QR680_004088 [Steinernema hermaphroditum]
MVVPKIKLINAMVSLNKSEFDILAVLIGFRTPFTNLEADVVEEAELFLQFKVRFAADQSPSPLQSIITNITQACDLFIVAKHITHVHYSTVQFYEPVFHSCNQRIRNARCGNHREGSALILSSSRRSSKHPYALLSTNSSASAIPILCGQFPLDINGINFPYMIWTSTHPPNE